MDTEENEVSLLDLLLVVAENLKLLVFGPLAVGLLVLGVMFLLPKTYTSEALLNLGESSKAAESVMRSPAVLDGVLKKYPVAGVSVEVERDALSKKFRFSAGGPGQKLGAGPAKLEVDGESPERAQALANALIDAWLATTKPTPLMQLELERKLKGAQNSLTDISSMVSKFQSEAGKAVTPGLQRDFSASIGSLLKLRDEYTVTIALIENQLLGSTRDAVISPPTLAFAPASSKKGLIAALAALAVGFALLLWVFARQAWRTAAQNPQDAQKQARLRAALGLK